MRVLLRWVLLGSILTTVGPVRALAQPAPAVNKTDVAKQYVNAGLAAQSSGDYDTAITFYSKAYQLVPHPVLIFNIAQAHRLAGRTEKALSLYAQYLSEDPNGAQAQTARDIVADIQAQKQAAVQKAEDARKAEAARKADEARKVDEARRARAAEDARKAEDKRVADTAPSSQEPPRAGSSDRAPGRNLRLYGIAAGGVGVVSLGIGIGFGVHAQSLSSELSKNGAVYNPSTVDSGERANKVAIAGLVSGTVLVAAGATLYWLGYKQGVHQEGLTFAPMVSSQLAGFAVVGTLP